MSSIDKRIVQMQFDNQNFESGVSKTMSSLKKLNESLKMKGSSEGLDSVNKGINKLSANGMSGLSSGVETVTAKFSALGVIGMTALANITNSAVNAGKNLVKSFAIDPIMDGFSEYELKMNSIQTILTNTQKHGTTLDDVNKALNTLNEYSDKTIYNFAQMTDNIGKATAAGLTLEDSVKFVQGMSNVAAGFGVDATSMAGATYQMTQALSAGVVKLQDWVSMERSGMAGSLLQEELIATAESMGVVVDKSKPFRDTLESGWLSAEIFTATMEKMANDPSLTAAASNVTSFTKLLGTLKETVGSGWAQSFEHIFGDKEESTKLWTGISNSLGDIINKSAEARNKVLIDWKELGGRDDVIKGFTNIFQSLGKGFKSIGEAWKEVFPSMTGEKLADLSEKFKNFTEKIKMSDDTAKKIKDTFKGVFNVFKTVGSVIGNVAKAFSPLLGALKPIGSAVLSATAGIGNFITKISEAVANSKIFTKIADGIKSAFENIGDFLGTVGDKIRNFFSGMDFSGITNFVSGVFTTISGVLSSIGSGIGKALGTINFETLSNIVKSLLGFGALKSLKGIFDKVSEVGDGLSGVFESFSGIGENVKNVLDSTKEALASWQNSLNAGTLMKLAGAIAILAGALLLLASIEPTKLATALAGMAGLFAEMSLAMLAINKIGDIKGLTKTSTGMILMSTAILILASAMKKLSGLNVGEVLTGLVSIAGLLATMTVAVKIFKKSAGDLGKTSTGLIIFGAAMHVMASALEKLGSIDSDVVGGGLFTMLGVLAELALFLKVAKFDNMSISTGLGVLSLATSLLVLSKALQMFGAMDPTNIITGLAGIAAILSEIIIFSELAEVGDMVKLAGGLIVMSAALGALSSAMGAMGSMEWETIAKGLISIGGALTIFSIAAKSMQELELATLAVGLGLMGGAMMIVGSAIEQIGSMSLEQLATGLLGMSSALLIMGVAMAAISGLDAMADAAAIVVMAAGLALLTPQIVALGQLDINQVGVALVALSGALLLLGIAGYAITPALPGLLGLGAAVALLGVGCLAAGAGVAAFAAGMASLGATLAVSGALILSFIKDLMAQLPQLGLKAGEAMVNFAGAIGKGAPQIISAFNALFTAILQAISKNIPAIAKMGVELVVGFAEALASGVPRLVSAGLELVLGILEGIATNIGNVVSAAADIVVNFINGIAANLGNVINAGINLALSFIEGVANGISSNSGRLEAAIRSVIQAMAQAGLAVIKGAISGFTSGGKTLLEGFCNGVKSMMSSAGSAVKSCIDSAKSAASNLGSALVGAGKSLIEGLVSGISSMASSVAEKARSVVSGAIEAAKSALKINSPSKVFISIGKSVDEGFIDGLNAWSNKVNHAATGLTEGVINNAKEPLSNLASMIDANIDANPTITPVLDLTNVERNSRRLGDLVSGNGALSLTADKANLMASSIGQIQNGTNNSDIVSALKDLKASMADNRPSYTVNGITYDDGTNVSKAIETLVRAAKIERRI